MGRGEGGIRDEKENVVEEPRGTDKTYRGVALSTSLGFERQQCSVETKRRRRDEAEEGGQEGDYEEIGGILEEMKKQRQFLKAVLCCKIPAWCELTSRVHHVYILLSNSKKGPKDCCF